MIHGFVSIKLIGSVKLTPSAQQNKKELNMDSPKRVLIVGAKGCGKTSLIAQLTKKIATPKTTKLEENYQESKLAAKFKGERFPHSY